MRHCSLPAFRVITRLLCLAHLATHQTQSTHSLCATRHSSPGDSVDKADAQGMTPLLYACKNGQMRLAKYLLKEHLPSVRVSDAQGWTCMHFLAGAGTSSELGRKSALNLSKAKERFSNQNRLDVADMVLAQGGDVNAKANGVSAFYVACMEGDLELVKLCLDHNAHVDAIGEAEDEPQPTDRMSYGNDNMKIEDWTDDSVMSWSVDGGSNERPEEAYGSSSSFARSKRKSYRERVSIFQRDREEEAIGESGTVGLGPWFDSCTPFTPGVFPRLRRRGDQPLQGSSADQRHPEAEPEGFVLRRDREELS